MAVSTLLNAVTATGTGTALKLFVGDTAQPRNYRRGARGLVKAVLTGTATVSLEGSLTGTSYVTIVSLTASGIYEITLPPYLRGNVTAFTSGTVTLMVEHGAAL
jgi:hypothetical protein